jgi:hypothetical protein
VTPVDFTVIATFWSLSPCRSLTSPVRKYWAGRDKGPAKNNKAKTAVRKKSVYSMRAKLMPGVIKQELKWKFRQPAKKRAAVSRTSP